MLMKIKSRKVKKLTLRIFRKNINENCIFKCFIKTFKLIKS